ncbi:MAG: hypothetical protein KF901_11950 [Myxococcales bacterium]|nr:hypothetical protein [Myxococcales bacterium]
MRCISRHDWRRLGTVACEADDDVERRSEPVEMRRFSRHDWRRLGTVACVADDDVERRSEPVEVP